MTPVTLGMVPNEIGIRQLRVAAGLMSAGGVATFRWETSPHPTRARIAALCRTLQGLLPYLWDQSSLEQQHI